MPHGKGLSARQRSIAHGKDFVAQQRPLPHGKGVLARQRRVDKVRVGPTKFYFAVQIESRPLPSPSF
jgi:hypothetical protein